MKLINWMYIHIYILYMFFCVFYLLLNAKTLLPGESELFFWRILASVSTQFFVVLQSKSAPTPKHA